MDLELAKLFFPEGVLEYFDIKKFKEEHGKVHFYLEGKNILHEEYQSEQATSIGAS